MMCPPIYVGMVTRLGSIALLYRVVGETEGGGEKC